MYIIPKAVQDMSKRLQLIAGDALNNENTLGAFNRLVLGFVMSEEDTATDPNHSINWCLNGGNDPRFEVAKGYDGEQPFPDINGFTTEAKNFGKYADIYIKFPSLAKDTSMNVMFLDGTFGAGKTTLCRAICQSLTWEDVPAAMKKIVVDKKSKKRASFAGAHNSTTINNIKDGRFKASYITAEGLGEAVFTKIGFTNIYLAACKCQRSADAVYSHVSGKDNIFLASTKFVKWLNRVDKEVSSRRVKYAAHVEAINSIKAAFQSIGESDHTENLLQHAHEIQEAWNDIVEIYLTTHPTDIFVTNVVEREHTLVSLISKMMLADQELGCEIRGVLGSGDSRHHVWMMELEAFMEDAVAALTSNASTNLAASKSLMNVTPAVLLETLGITSSDERKLGMLRSRCVQTDGASMLAAATSLRKMHEILQICIKYATKIDTSHTSESLDKIHKELVAKLTESPPQPVTPIMQEMQALASILIPRWIDSFTDNVLTEILEQVNEELASYYVDLLGRVSLRLKESSIEIKMNDTVIKPQQLSTGMYYLIILLLNIGVRRYIDHLRDMPIYILDDVFDSINRHTIIHVVDTLLRTSVVKYVVITTRSSIEVTSKTYLHELMPKGVADYTIKIDKHTEWNDTVLNWKTS